MKITKPYITLRDRMWKGKDWFSGFRSQKFIRKLTEEEANSLDNIQEVILPKYDDILDTSNGKIHCKKCGNLGLYCKTRPFGKEIKVWSCPNCKLRQVEKIKK